MIETAHLDSALDARPTAQQVSMTSSLAVCSMVLGLLSLVLSLLTAIPAIIIGIVALMRISGSNGKLKGSEIAVAGIATGTVFPIIVFYLMLWPAISAVRAHTWEAQSRNNVRLIGIGMRNHETARRRFPQAGGVADSRSAALSWRVHLLPHVDEYTLYDQFNLDEPWDSEHNKKLIVRMPDVYLSPGVNLEAGKTVYLAAIGNGAAFQGESRGPSIHQFKDGTSNTVMVVEASPDQAVIWTKADDWRFDPASPKRGLGGIRTNGFLALFADGHVASVDASIHDDELRAMFTRAGGELN